MGVGDVGGFALQGRPGPVLLHLIASALPKIGRDVLLPGMGSREHVLRRVSRRVPLPSEPRPFEFSSQEGMIGYGPVGRKTTGPLPY